VAKLSPLGFKLDKQTAKPLKSMSKLLADVPPSRLFDETLKLLQTGHALQSVEQLQLNGLSRGIYSILDLVVERADQPMIKAALEDTDRRVGEGKPVVPSFLLSCLLWVDVLEKWQSLSAQMPAFQALQEAIDAVFDARIGDVSGRGKLAADMREIWTMQPRFDKQTGRAPLSLLAQPRFRAGFDFLRLRARVGEVPQELANWWETFSTAYPDEQEQMLEDKRQEQMRQQRNPKATAKTKRVSKSSSPKGVASSAVRELADAGESAKLSHFAGEQASDADPAALTSKPKRRRRRKSSSAAQPGAHADPTSNEQPG
jgi:poly(A) polymerase